MRSETECMILHHLYHSPDEYSFDNSNSCAAHKTDDRLAHVDFHCQHKFHAQPRIVRHTAFLHPLSVDSSHNAQSNTPTAATVQLQKYIYASI